MAIIEYSEYVMQLDCLRRMRANGIVCGIEVAHSNHSIDLLWITDGNILHACELKLTNWKTALKQAQYHQETADYVYVIMPPRQMNKPIRQAFNESGVGFLEYIQPIKFDGNDFTMPYKTLIPAVKDTSEGGFRDIYRDKIIKRLIDRHESELMEARMFVTAFE